jgi:hypothetical protein
MRRRTAIALSLAALTLAPAAPPAAADTITVEGKTYSDVLVYKSSSLYYVKIPNEGRTFSVPVEDVPENAVYIERDPYVRDALQEKYDKTEERQKEAAWEGDVSDPTFAVQAGGGSSGTVDTSGLLGGGGAAAAPEGAASLVPDRESFGRQLQNFGLTVENSGDTSTFRSPDGSTTIAVSGPGDFVSRIVVNAKVPQEQANAAMAQLMPLLGRVAPWSTGFLGQNRAALLKGGSAEKTQDGVAISINSTAEGPNLSFTVTVRAV